VDLALKDILLLPLARHQLRYQSLVPLTGIFVCLQGILVQEGVCEVAIYSLEWMPFGDQRSKFFISVNILHGLMESRGTMELR